MNCQTVFILIQVFIAATCVTEIYSKTICNPQTNCWEHGIGALIIDPEDCHNYYVCITDVEGNSLPSDDPLICPPNQYFDGAQCMEEISPCANPCMNYNCKVECDSDIYGPVAYLGDCHKYVLCLDGKPVAEDECPDHSPYFNGVKCTQAYECCNFCTPYCLYANMEVRDPKNCKKYYLCLVAGTVPTENYHFACEEGSYFDPKMGHCQLEDEQSPCTALCDNTTFPSFV